MQLVGGIQDLLNEGSRHFQGLEQAVLRNIEACKSLTSVTKTSLGPYGMNKIVINRIDKTFMTSEAATIVREMEVMHPAAKILSLAAQKQQEEFADGANILLTFSGELLTNAENLLRIGIHPNNIVSGYKKALDHVLKRIDELVAYTITDLKDKNQVLPVLKSVLGSKFYGYEDILAPLVAQACISANTEGQFDQENIKTATVLGGSLQNSYCFKGVVLTKDVEGSVRKVENARIGVFGCAFDPEGTESKAIVMIKNAEDLQNYALSEEFNTQILINDIVDSGINVIIIAGKISFNSQHFLESRNVLILKCEEENQLKSIVKATGASGIVRMAKPPTQALGKAELVECQEIGNTVVTIMKNSQSQLSTIVVRGASKKAMEEAERAIAAAVSAYFQATFCQQYLPGAGACEMLLSKSLKQLASQEPSLDQYAIQKFAEALEIVPRMIAENAGLNGNKVLSKMYQTNGGVNIETGEVWENPTIYDHLETKKSAIRLATEAVNTLLKIDTIIMSKPGSLSIQEIKQSELDDM